MVNDNSKVNYNSGNKIMYNTEVLKSDLCDYNDAFTLVKGDNTVPAATEIQVAFKKCASFTECITKIDGTTIDDAEDSNLVMPMYSLIEYSSNYPTYLLILIILLQKPIILNLSSIRLNY